MDFIATIAYMFEGRLEAARESTAPSMTAAPTSVRPPIMIIRLIMVMKVRLAAALSPTRSTRRPQNPTAVITVP